MFALLGCVCEPTLSHQTASIKPLQKCGPYMSMAVLIKGNRIPKLICKINCSNSGEMIRICLYCILKICSKTLPRYTVARAFC